MGTKIYIIGFLFMFTLVHGFTQDISRKARREKNKIEKQRLIDSLMNSKEFVFEAKRALPQGGSSVDLTGNINFVKFHPEKIESYLPFFGRAYSIDYGGDGGIKFEGKPSGYTIVRRKGGKGFEVNATIRTPRDNYKLIIFVSPEGNASLTINSNQRSVISYDGDIAKYAGDEENGK